MNALRARLLPILIVGLFGASCYKLQKGGLRDPNAARADGAVDSRTDAPSSGNTGTGGANGLVGSEGCQPGWHMCNGACVDGKLTENCGLSCEPCPQVIGGVATCDGLRCDGTCPAGKRKCLNACIDEAMPCADDRCEPGQNPCNGACVDAKSLMNCGSACARCPTSPNGTATCDGDTCSLVCNDGFHRCGDECVKNTDPETCGASCTKCPAPVGGDATCDGTKCGARCPDGQKLCAGKCIDMAAMCTESCMPGQIDCQGTCASPTDVNFCGPTCQACKPPANADATCNGTTCDFTCRPSFCRDGNACKDSKSVESCGTACTPCPKPANATPTCNGTKCDFRCNTGFRNCGGVCKPVDTAEACGAECTACTAPSGGTPACVNGQCQVNCGGGTSYCPSTKQCVPPGQPCGGMCPGGQQLCNGACVPSASVTAERCDGKDNDCDGQTDEGLNETCSNKCTTGMRVCRNGSFDSSGCPPTVQCCNDGDCGSCEECNNGSCRPQAAGQDKKNACATGTCRTGNCDGAGKCGNRTGTFCTGGNLVTCNANGTESTQSCGGMGCNGTTCNQCTATTCDGTTLRRCNNGQLSNDSCGGRGCAGTACCGTGTHAQGGTCVSDKKDNGASCSGNGDCLSNRCIGNVCCGTACDTTTRRCAGNAIVVGTCAGGSCGNREVGRCDNDQTCMGAGNCVDNCTPNQPCNTNNPCTTGRTTCPSGCMQVERPDGTVCPTGVCLNGNCDPCGGEGQKCCPNNTCKNPSTLGCTDGTCSPCGRFHNDPCCGNPGSRNCSRAASEYMGELRCVGVDNTCINTCGERGRSCCGEMLCNNGLACNAPDPSKPGVGTCP